MKHKVILSGGEIATIVSELEIAINSTSDYAYAMRLSNIVKKLQASEGDTFHMNKPHAPLQPVGARA